MLERGHADLLRCERSDVRVGREQQLVAPVLPSWEVCAVDPAAQDRIRKAVDTAKQAAHTVSLDGCDVGDLDEAFEAVDQQLDSPHPNANTLTLDLNSIARSLVTVPQARRACDAIDAALRGAGLPATWEQ